MITLKQKHAFTMVELVFVVIVLGILTSLALPSFNADKKQEAADDILSQIRYTQHLALLDDRHMRNKQQWQKRFWQIQFVSCTSGGLFYRIGNDDDMNSSATFEMNEAATDPLNGKPLYSTNNTCASANPNVLLGKKYGVDSIGRSGGCSGQYIGFDHLGRPHVGFSSSNKPDYRSYMKRACIFTFIMSDTTTFKISIQPETGYAQIVGQNDS